MVIDRILREMRLRDGSRVSKNNIFSQLLIHFNRPHV
jgi:hypothetical protein